MSPAAASSMVCAADFLYFFFFSFRVTLSNVTIFWLWLLIAIPLRIYAKVNSVSFYILTRFMFRYWNLLFRISFLKKKSKKYTFDVRLPFEEVAFWLSFLFYQIYQKTNENVWLNTSAGLNTEKQPQKVGQTVSYACKVKKKTKHKSHR